MKRNEGDLKSSSTIIPGPRALEMRKFTCRTFIIIIVIQLLTLRYPPSGDPIRVNTPLNARARDNLSMVTCKLKASSIRTGPRMLSNKP